MGIDISGGMIVGCYGCDLKVEDLYELVEEQGLDVFSPYYDAGYEDSIIGISLKDHWELEDLPELIKQSEEAKASLLKLGFTDVKLYATQNVW